MRTDENAYWSGPVARSQDFADISGQYRGELLAHCYRMLGSADEAEDLVQESLLRAWRSYDRFEGRSSVRTWLYRIATNACLTALERRGRRPLPSGLSGPTHDPNERLRVDLEVPWLQPLPDALISYRDPALITASRADVRLAFVAALQYLSARQRAILILRDVLEWHAADVAELLGTTIIAVNSGLRRARAQLARSMPERDELAEPDDRGRRLLLERFAVAVENADNCAIAELLRVDAVLEMPPYLTWFAGRKAVAGFIGSQLLTAPGNLKLLPVAANGQAAFAVYRRNEDAAYDAHALQVLTLAGTGIARLVVFASPPQRLSSFGVPESIPPGPC